jgi:phospholipid/cholesterol/gamma-HCH transport system substrate-binding protein
MTKLQVQNKPFVAGVVLIALFGGAVLFGLNSTHGMPLVERKEVRVAFDDLSGLNVGDDVRIASTRVGYVDAIELEDGGAVAVLKLDDPDTELYENARAARVSDRSGLGQKFVNLDPGDPSTGALSDGGTIPVEQTVRSEDVNQLLDVFDPRTREQASVSLRNFGGGMTGHGEDLHALADQAPELLTDTGELSQALAAGDGVPLERMLTSAGRLSARMAERSDEVAALTEQLATTVDAFGADGGAHLRGSLALAPTTLDTAQTALQSLDQPLTDTAVAMRQLRPGASALGRSTPDLRGLLREAVTPLDKVPAVSEDAVPGLASLTQLVDDARPLTEQLVKTGESSAPFASVFGAYAADIAAYYRGAADTLSHGDSAGNWLRILLVPGTESIAGSPIPIRRDPYQPPGGAR